MQLEFVSYSEDDLDYEGYEFSVTGKLSEVRLVFLNRFIQEVRFKFLTCKDMPFHFYLFLKCSV